MPTDPQTNPSISPETAPPTAPPVPVQGDGTPDYSHLDIQTEPPLPVPDHAGGSATEPESGGGYSG